VWLAVGGPAEFGDGALGPVTAGAVAGQPVVQGKTRVELVDVGDRWVSLKFRDERRQRVPEIVQEPEHLLSRDHVFHHHEAHEVQAEVMCGRGGCYGHAEPGHMGRPDGLRQLVHAAMPG